MAVKTKPKNERIKTMFGEDDGVRRNGKAARGAGVREKQKVGITPINQQTVTIPIRGMSQYQQNCFSARAQQKMVATMEAGETSRKGAKRAPKDFNACYEEAMHKDAKGRFGIPATAFRAALVRACSLCGFAMSVAKLCLFVEEDAYNVNTGHPLVLFSNGAKPHRVDFPMRNANGHYDIRPLPMFNPGWECKLRVTFDSDQFTLADVINLTRRAGLQVGVGGGRNDAPGMKKIGVGMGFGKFDVVGGAAKLLKTLE